MIAEKIHRNLQQASLIRAMFEEGEKLRAIYGADKVFDFSLGNPDPEPPKEVKDSLRKLVMEDRPGLHGYMNNAGYPETREKIAEAINKETGKKLSAQHIVMTCGAGGALNITLKTILNPGEEVIVFTPYFGEYTFYIDNYSGTMVELPSNPDTFEPDLAQLEKSITPLTKAIIINSPNNPTGVVYSEQLLKEMARIVDCKEENSIRLST